MDKAYLKRFQFLAMKSMNYSVDFKSKLMFLQLISVTVLDSSNVGRSDIFLQTYEQYYLLTDLLFGLHVL